MWCFSFLTMVWELHRKSCLLILSGDGNQRFRRNQYCHLQYAPTASGSLRRPDYGLSYSSEPGSGTEVQIRIPAKKDGISEEQINTETK